MEIHHGLQPVSNDKPVYAAIGNFDGIHWGHQVLLSRLIDDARRDGALSLVMTFDPHPLMVLAPDRAPHLITSPVERAHLLESLGLDILRVVPFTADLAATEAEHFLRDILVGALGVRRLYMGESAAFGRGRRGTPKFVRELEPETGCGVTVVRVEGRDSGEPVSSTLIRKDIARGAMDRVIPNLTRPYVLGGTVIRGAGRGHTTGAKTANIAPPPRRVMPARGVYAVRCCVGGELLDGVANLGVRPTFAREGEEEDPVLEVHLFEDGPGSFRLYDRRVRIAFMEFIRPEQRFDSVDELSRQIQIDIGRAQRALAAAPAIDRDFLCLSEDSAGSPAGNKEDFEAEPAKKPGGGPAVGTGKI